MDCLLSGEIKDPRLQKAHITRVESTPDLSMARIYVRPIDGDANQKNSLLKGFASALPFLRRRVGERLQIQKVPELRVFWDEGMEASTRLDELFDEIHRGDKG